MDSNEKILLAGVWHVGGLLHDLRRLRPGFLVRLAPHQRRPLHAGQRFYGKRALAFIRLSFAFLIVVNWRRV